MKAKMTTIEKWWDSLLPVEKSLAYWQVRALKHAEDAEALNIVRTANKFHKGMVAFLKRRRRKIAKLREQAGMPSERSAAKILWN